MMTFGGKLWARATKPVLALSAVVLVGAVPAGWVMPGMGALAFVCLALGLQVWTNRRHIAALRVENGQYRLMSDNSHELLIRIGEGGVVQAMSLACQAMLGAGPSVWLGRRFIDLVHPDDRDGLEAGLHAALGGAGGSAQMLYRMARTDGSHIWLESRLRPVVDAQGVIDGVVTCARDAGERMRAVQLEHSLAMQLNRRNQLFEQAENLANLGHWSMNQITGEMVWSKGLYRIYGIDEPCTPSLDLTLEQIHPDERARVAELKHAAIVRGEPWAYRARIRRADGGVRHVSVAGHPFKDDHGCVTELFSIVLDVTDEVQAHEALSAARDAARAMAEARSVFMATMSHEIRTPMTGVLGMIELLRGPEGGADRERTIQALEQSSRLLRRILDDVLDFSRIEAGLMRFESIDFDLGQLLTQTFDLFEQTALPKGLRLELHPCAEAVLPMRGDPLRLQQLLSNLITNAIKFTAEGFVRIAWSVTDHRLTCSVTDTGIGIAPERIAHVFEPYAQADASTTRRFGGSGLGLTICKRLVEGLGGEMGVTSCEGQGSTFWFVLDLAPASVPSSVPASAPVVPVAAALPHVCAVCAPPMRILLAEDNVTNQALIIALLEREGHQVTCVGDGCQAVAAAADQTFDLVLMDMQMPVMDGIAATCEIRRIGARNAETPIIALTADAAMDRRARYEGIGLSGFLTKPIDTRRLWAMLAALGDEMPPADVVPPDGVVLNAAKLDDLGATIGSERLGHILALFLAELDRAPDQIEALVHARRMREAGFAAHALKGAAGNVGAFMLHDVAGHIEEHIADANPDQSRAVLGDLRKAVQATRVAIHGLS